MSDARYPLEDGTFSRHRPAWVSVAEQRAQVDEKIAPLIVELWRAGWPTSRSCQHHGPSRKVWIEFDAAADAAVFLSVVANGAPASVVKRIDWCFACFRRQSEPNLAKLADAWELHTQITGTQNEPIGLLGIAVSVLFPRRDLPLAIEHMRTFNGVETKGKR